MATKKKVELVTKKIQFNWQNEVYEETIEGSLELSELTPMETRNAINRAVGKYAFYGALMADALRLKSQIENDFAYWKGLLYLQASEENSKATEGYKNTWIAVHHKKEWDEWQMKLRNMEAIVNKIDILRSAFKLQANVLQTVGSMLKSEFELSHLGMAPAVGKGNILE